ncbi:hypothetical protein [Actinocrispum wychmicini]|uniref:hypothetical protein n=1 Tax=Actinocrispum wychmicini TaxID=1213861 RepID=UPI001052E61B|nr:hypothetical protein [Actinocrispum wychmicini]
MRKRVGVCGLALIGLVSCTGPERSGHQPVNDDPVTGQGPEICSLLPAQSLAHVTARAEDRLSSLGELGFDRGQCEVMASEDAGRQTVASLRVDVDQPGVAARVNAAIQVAKDRSARSALPNPLRTGTDTAPSVSLAITCGNRPVQIGLDITGYDQRRQSRDEDLAALAGVIATKYGEKARCRPTVAAPLAEEQRGTVRMVAGTGGAGLPTSPAPGPETSIGHVEALTTLNDGTVYLVSRKYPADVNPRDADDSTAPWGRTLRIVRIRTDGVVEVVWDPTLAPFSTNDDPVAGDLSQKLRLQGRDTLGAVSAIVVNGDQAWLVPANSSSTKGGTLARPVRIVQLSTGRAVDLRAIKAPLDVDSTKVRDRNGNFFANPMGVWNAARFDAVSFEGPTPVLLDSAHGQVWRINGLADGKILDTTVFPIGTPLAPGAGVAGLTGGRFAASSSQGGLVILDGHGKVPLTIPTVTADIDLVGRGPVELGRRQLAAAGDDVLVHAMSSGVSAPVVVRVDSHTGGTRTLQVSGYPGPRDLQSDVENTRFAKGYGTAANATGLFSTGFPVSAMGMVGQDLLLAPFGTRILYEFVPKR